MTTHPSTPPTMTVRLTRMHRGIASALLAGIVLACVLLTAPGAAWASDDSENDLAVSVPAVPSATPPGDNNTPRIPPGTGGLGAPRGGGTTGGGTTSATTTPPASPLECVPVEPRVPNAPASNGEDASVDKDVYRAGDDVNATASGFLAGEQVQLVMFSEPALVGSFTADDTGTVRAAFPMDKEALPGTHTLQFTGWCDGIKVAKVLVGSATAGTGATAEGVPLWIWWVGGALGLLVVAGGAWYVIRVMRAPALGEETN